MGDLHDILGMIKFWIQIFVVTAILSVIVWFGLPLLRPGGVPTRYTKVATLITESEKSAAVVASITGVTTQLVETVKAAGTEFVETAGKGLAEVTGDSKIKSALDSLISAPNGTTNTAAPQIEVEPDPNAPLNADPGYAWGIVVTNSFFHDAQMNRRGIMVGGTIVARKSLRLLPKGRAAECVYLKEDRL